MNFLGVKNPTFRLLLIINNPAKYGKVCCQEGLNSLYSKIAPLSFFPLGGLANAGRIPAPYNTERHTITLSAGLWTIQENYIALEQTKRKKQKRKQTKIFMLEKV